MQTTTLFYVIVTLLLSVAIAFFQYFYKVKNNPKINILLFVLKTLSLFILGLLLINPKITTTKTENIKPILSVLVDNSLSTEYFKQKENINNILTSLKADNALHKKFDVHYFSFGNSTKPLDSLTFTDVETNIYDGIKAVDELYKDNLGTTLLISDGNQTIGNDYEFIKSKKAIYPLVVGDTTLYKDVKITQLNTNKYSYIKNKFPVEALLNYDGNDPVTTQYSIFYKRKTVFTQKIDFSKENNSKTVLANLKATQEGLQYYTASIKKLKNEKNIKNNTRNFSVEVLNQQSKVLVLTSILHPDLGALKKAIESNKQRKVDVVLINNFKNKLTDYQFTILYQPNNKFNYIVPELKSNYLVITGSQTDWEFVNSQSFGYQKEAIDNTENYQAIYNDTFLTFLQKNINFKDFPPLKDKFGEITLNTSHQILLNQKIAGINSSQPLVATFEEGENKSAVIFGENLWQWRSASYRASNSFEDFDGFIGNLVQYLSSNKKRNRLTVTAKNIYPANSTINISAFYVDKTYQFDNRASLLFSLTNTKTKEKKTVPFSLVTNAYQVDLENLSAGNYSYKVSVNGQNIEKYGRFKITDFQVEEQFTNANYRKLKRLADKTGGKLFFTNQNTQLAQELINNTSYYTTQKAIKKEQNLIDWKWILFIAVFLLALEWFIRKYYGKI